MFVSTVPCDKTEAKVTSLEIQAAAIGDGTILTVWAVDQVGNVSRNIEGQARSFKFTVGVKDQPQNTLVPVTPAGGAVWKTIPVDVASGRPDSASCSGGTVDGNSSASGDEGRALEVPAGGRAVSSVPAVDASHSFTTAAWICPTQVGGSIRSIVTQLAGPGSPAARLAVNPDTKFILQGWPQGGTAPDEVATTTDIVAGQWSYVVAAYDETNSQLRITQSDSNGSLTTWVTATSPEKQLASVNQPVVLGDSGTAGADQFTGQIFRPVMTQSILTADQVKAIAYTYPAGEGVMK
ncbi:LamG-like jellyroll fold domain-containing protein [Arthrobacter woluwensis]|uniref:LamG-like jellyroll fold domain-containing protein n=1 Tax=Arthrobacter woluwensis TaxID=156980 RepID=UPI001AAE476C|nr:LamG-like jellyroll fold domain-containing protein [Arthrobacter woluwensis]QTF73192.1 LamG domain-containing protein [Arthrobacter woluwensis]